MWKYLEIKWLQILSHEGSIYIKWDIIYIIGFSGNNTTLCKVLFLLLLLLSLLSLMLLSGINQTQQYLEGRQFMSLEQIFILHTIGVVNLYTFMSIVTFAFL